MSAVGRTQPNSPAKRSTDGSKTVLEVKKENSLARQGSNPRGKGAKGEKEEEFDDKEFEKRYEGKLGKSTDGAAATKSQDGSKAKQVATPSAASQKAVKSGAPPEREKSVDKFEKALTKSDINKINTQQQQNTSSIRESIHDSYSGF